VIGYDTIRYDTILFIWRNYLTRKWSKNKLISMISPVQSSNPWRQSRGWQKPIKVERVCWKVAWQAVWNITRSICRQVLYCRSSILVHVHNIAWVYCRLVYLCVGRSNSNAMRRVLSDGEDCSLIARDVVRSTYRPLCHICRQSSQQVVWDLRLVSSRTRRPASVCTLYASVPRTLCRLTSRIDVKINLFGRDSYSSCLILIVLKKQ